jgi:tungstate transport system substrate-binding protein
MLKWCFVLLGLTLHLQAFTKDNFIILASTTSTEDSGLFKYLLPLFKASTGIEVRVVAQGTGQAIASARRGDCDVLLVHDLAAELKFVADGFGLDRRDVMANDFVLVGPKSDPAKIAAGSDLLLAFKNIAASASPFVSRGDKSGTHVAELRYWELAQVDPLQGRGSWYRMAGSGMGPTLNISSAMNAYTISDRATWLSFKNRGALTILVEGDRRLMNPYGVLLVNPIKHPHVKAAQARVFIEWITSREGQAAIASYKIDGQQLFFPSYLGIKKSP